MAELTEQEKAAISREYRRKTNREYLRVWRDANREKYNEYHREYRRKYRERQRQAAMKTAGRDFDQLSDKVVNRYEDMEPKTKEKK